MSKTTSIRLKRAAANTTRVLLILFLMITQVFTFTQGVQPVKAAASDLPVEPAEAVPSSDQPSTSGGVYEARTLSAFYGSITEVTVQTGVPVRMSLSGLTNLWSVPLQTVNPEGSLAPVMDGSGNADVIYNVGCMQESAGFNLNCTANDISIARATNINILDDGCAFPGDTVTFKADFEVLLTAQARYDVGLWFSQDGDPNGDAAKTGTCTAATPAYAPDPPWLDLDQTVSGQADDTCGDIDDAHNPLFPSVTLTVMCVDDDKNGKLDLPNCTSWRQPGDNSLCTSPTQAVPGAPSKCKCDTGFNVDIKVPGQIIVDKVTSPAGLTTNFDFTLTGSPTGGSPISPINFSLADATTPFKSSFLYAGTYSVVETANSGFSTSATCSDGSPANAVTLDPGEIVTCTFTNTLLTGTLVVEKDLVNDNLGPRTCPDFSYQVDGGSAVAFESDCSNTQTVLAGAHTVVEAGVPITGYTTTYSNCANVNVPAGGTATCKITNDDIAMPSMTVDKSSTTTSLSVPGTVTYNYLVTNIGNTTLTGITLSDDNDNNDMACLATTLAPKATTTCTATHTFTQAELDLGGTLDNIVTADSDQTGPVTDNLSIPINQTPLLSITKVSPETGYDTVGDVLNYTIVVTNDGNTTLAAVTVSDPSVTGLTCTPANGSTLAPGASMTCTATHTITQADLDAGHWANTACVDDGTGGASQACASKDVPGTQNPHLAIAKTATEASYAAPGAILHYSITVTNDGNVTLANVTVTDPLVTDLTCSPPNGSTLAPGETMTCTATHTVTQADIDAGHWGNQACVDDGPEGAPGICDTEDVPGTQTPHLAISKEAAEGGYNTVGDVLNYTIVVTNDGNTTLAAVTVSDPSVTGLTCTPANGSTLAPGASMTCTATHTITQADLDAGHWANTACVDDGTGGASEVCASKDVPGITDPALYISKVATETSYNAVGDILTYTITAINIGNVTLANVTVADPLVSDLTCSPANGSTLAPGDIITCTATHTVTQADIDAGHWGNQACVDDGAFGAPEACDTEDVPGTKNPVLTLVKTATPGTYDSVDDLISYSFLLTNAGNVTLTAPFSVTDDKTTDESCPVTPASLAPGESITCTASYLITQPDLDAGSVTNTAQGHGFLGENPVDSNTDSETVTAVKSPLLAIVKTATPTTYKAVGEVINYSYLVTNTGNVTLYNLTVIDDKATVTCPDTSAGLWPTAWIICSASYTITQADLDIGSVTNTAYATDGTIQSEPDTKTVTAEQYPAIQATKTGTWIDGNGDGFADPGETITYAFSVKNTGNVTLTNVTITDPKLTVVGGPISLAPGQEDTTTFTGSYLVTQADINAGTVHNVALASGTPPFGPPVTFEPPTDTHLPQNPALALVKTGSFDAGADGFANPGELISYTFVVTNTGNVTLTGVTVTDPKVANIICDANTIPVGGFATCTGSYAVTQADIDAGSVYNMATADSTQSGPDTDNETVPLPWNPALTLVKTGAFNSGTDAYANVDEVITYTFVVTNTGNVTLTGVTVSDPLNGLSAISCPKTTLAVGENMTCTATYGVTQADIDAGRVDNTATADSTQSGPDIDDETVPLPQHPALAIDKTASPATYASVGEVISYSYQVVNTGNVTLYNLTVVDDKATVTCPNTSSGLWPTAWIICSATYTITQADLDAGSVTNTAYATNGTIQSEPDSETVRAIQTPAIEVQKSGTFMDENGDGYGNVGETIAYTFTVTNIGNVTLYNVVVTDPLVTVSGGPLAELAVGAVDSTTFTATYVLTQAAIDAGFVYNTATACGYDMQNDPACDEGDNNEPVPQNPALTLDKTGSFDAGADGYANVGELILYTFVVTNTGNVTLTGITVSDPLPDLSGISCPKATLAVGESMTCTANYGVTQDDIDAGSVYNMATANSKESEPATDDETVPLLQNPAVDIVKTTNGMDGGTFLVGSTVTWKYVVTNTGNVTLSSITVGDDKFGSVSCPKTSLAVGESMSCNATGTATLGAYENIGTVNAYDPQNDSATDSDNSAYFGADAAVDVEKYVSIDGGTTWVDADSATGPYLNTGTAPQFKFVVTNTGNVTLSGVSVTDSDFTLQAGCIAATLAVGASDDCIITGTWAEGQHTNTATTSGSFTDGAFHTDSTTDTDDANYFGSNPEIDLTKAGVWQDGNANGFAEAGELVNYTFTVKNTGNVTLTGITVTDPKVSSISCPKTELVVNESMTCTGSYTLTQADIYTGKVENTATASGSFTDDNGNTETDTDTSSATVTLPLAPTGAIRPTRTTCEQFRDGTGETMQQYYPPYGYVYYMLKGKLINSINPGVFFYYSAVTLAEGDFELSVGQTNNQGWPKIPTQEGDNIVLYDATCTKVQNLTAAYDPATGSAKISGTVPAGVYYISVKWQPSATYNKTTNNGLVGYAPTGKPLVTYSFQAYLKDSAYTGPITSSGASQIIAPKK